jgi:proteasome lid subunit RPN8/RPN11
MWPDSIVISKELRAQLRAQLDAALPRECCGVLLGERAGGRLTVRRVLRTINTEAAVGGFSVPDREMERVRFLAAQSGERIIALFHSHPSRSTELSEADRAGLSYSEWPWVIITPATTKGDVVLTYYGILRRLPLVPAAIG